MEPGRPLPHGAPVLRGGDHPLVEHRREHLVASRDRPRRVDDRVVDGRGLREPGEQGSLSQGQPPGRLREVGPCGCFRAVGEVPVEDRVEVAREDLLLRPLAVELHRETGLGQLALHRPLVRDVQVADELLRDRRAALHHAPGLHVPPERSRDAFGVEAAVVEESAILDRDRRLREPGRDAIERHDLPIPLGGDDTEQGAVGRVDERVLADPRRAERGQVAPRPEGDDGRATGDPGRDQEADEREDDDGEPVTPRGTAAANAQRRRGGSAPRTRAPRAGHGAMVATSPRGFTAHNRTPRRGMVARCFGRRREDLGVRSSQRHGRRS
jgi:hypothetical protein